MSVVPVHKVAVQRTFVAPLWSLTTLFYVLLFISQWVIPFFVAFATPSFWVKEGVYYEQPSVKFKRELISHFILSDGSQILWSDIPSVSKLSSAFRASPTLQTSASDIDNDYDGIPDVLRIKAMLPALSNGKTISVIRLLLLFQCVFSARAHVQMETDLFIEQPVPQNAKTLYIYGQFTLQQRQPFPLSTLSHPRIVYNSSVVSHNATKITDILFPSMLSRIASRNETLELFPIRSVWDYSPTSVSSSINIDLTLISPIQRVLYRPSFAETLKHAWVQYLAVWCIVWAVLHVIRELLFHHHSGILTIWEDKKPIKSHVK